MKASELDTALEKATKLNALLSDNPRLMAFATTLQETREPVLLLEKDRLIRAGEAAAILGVNVNMIGRYVKDKLLKPHKVPYTKQRRFLLSEVWGLMS